MSQNVKKQFSVKKNAAHFILHQIQVSFYTTLLLFFIVQAQVYTCTVKWEVKWVLEISEDFDSKGTVLPFKPSCQNLLVCNTKEKKMKEKNVFSTFCTDWLIMLQYQHVFQLHVYTVPYSCSARGYLYLWPPSSLSSSLF